MTLQCITRYFDNWLAEKYDASTINWEYAKANNGERPPNTQEESEKFNSHSVIEPVTKPVQTTIQSRIENSIDMCIESLVSNPMIIGIAKQIQRTGEATAKALEALTEFELLAVQQVVLELSS